MERVEVVDVRSEDGSVRAIFRCGSGKKGVWTLRLADVEDDLPSNQRELGPSPIKAPGAREVAPNPHVVDPCQACLFTWFELRLCP